MFYDCGFTALCTGLMDFVFLFIALVLRIVLAWVDCQTLCVRLFGCFVSCTFLLCVVLLIYCCFT